MMARSLVVPIVRAKVDQPRRPGDEAAAMAAPAWRSFAPSRQVGKSDLAVTCSEHEHRRQACDPHSLTPVGVQAVRPSVR